MNEVGTGFHSNRNETELQKTVREQERELQMREDIPSQGGKKKEDFVEHLATEVAFEGQYT